MIVALDCDGILSDFVGRYLQRVHLLSGRSYTRADVTDYAFRSLGLTAEQSRLSWLAMLQPGTAAGLDVLPGALHGVKRLRDAGCEIYVVTAPLAGNTSWSGEREAWLCERFGLQRSHIIHTSAKHMVAADVLIDDSPEHCARFPASSILWDAPYNRSAPAAPHVRRAKGWGDVLDELARIDSEMEGRDAR